MNKLHTTVVLAMSADGKIADFLSSPARFASSTDRAHLEKQIAIADGVLFGASTLRAYGTTLGISDPQLLKQRQENNKPLQPIQIVCSRLALIDPNLRFFRQPLPRWLLTTDAGAKHWQGKPEFERVLVQEIAQFGINWQNALQQLAELGLQRLAVLGGGELVASLLTANLIDELWLTVCPLILGGKNAPTPVAGDGFLASLAPRLQLLSVEAIDQEVFLHYRLVSFPDRDLKSANTSVAPVA